MKYLTLLTILTVVQGASLYDRRFSENGISKIGRQESLFPYLAGSAPYFKYPHDYGIDLPVPEHCQLKQVQLLARHGERFPSKGKGKQLNNTYQKLERYRGKFNGSLSFLNDEEYQWFLDDSSQLELEVTFENTLNPLNPYTGEQDARTHARNFLSLYGQLLNKNSNIELFTTNSKRVHDTAMFFSQELDNVVNSTHLNVISEDPSSGANNLSPGYSCLPWDEDENAAYLSTYSETYLEDIAERLNRENADIGLKLNKSDASLLFVWCSFELNAKGYSDVCNIFTNEELIHYSYQDDLTSYYEDGAGHSLIKPIGSLLFNASVELLKQSDKLQQKVWLSFTHDTDILNYLTTVGLFDDGKKLNTSYVPFLQHTFHKAWLTPMGARLYTEKFQCSNETYVRYTLNDAVIPIESCSTGPGFSCPEKQFYSYANKRLQGLNFVKSCNITSSSNHTSLSFYWDYNTTRYNASLILE
ncbi:acid phosphatase pho5 [Kluyveromyces marxianus]|nr:acid phosphatase pho5 [Kluyveromyces marxianus]KAG0678750.1 acid phosphatase pho5 [Kluyveromyces marxianus]